MEFDFYFLGIDFLVVFVYKFYGLKGVGIFYCVFYYFDSLFYGGD